MAIFSNFLGQNKTTTDFGFGNATYSNDELLGVYSNLTYEQCRDLFRFWAFGKRMVEALPNFAMSVGRIITFGRYTTPELIKRFDEISLQTEVDKKIKFTIMNARIYGMSAIYATSLTKNNPKKPLENVAPNDLVFNCLDPLSMRGTVQFDLEPLSPTFQQPINVRIDGKEIHSKRIKIINNEMQLFLAFNPSSFSFSGQSVFQNMSLLIRTYNRAMVALQRASTKAGAIVRNTKDISHANGINYKAIEKNNEMIRQMENDGIASIGINEQLTLFDINNIQQIGNIVEIVNKMFGIALNDTPTSILLDTNLSNGLNDGTEDMKSIIIAVEHFRNMMLKPLYDFTDEYILKAALTDEWLSEYIKLTDFKSVGEAYEMLKQSFAFEFKDLYPLTEIEIEERNKKKLENMLIMRNLGVNLADIENILNQGQIYGTEISIDLQPIGYDDEQDFDADGNVSFAKNGDKVQDPANIYRLVEKAKKNEK